MSRYVAAVLTRIGPLVRVQLDPRIAVAGDLRTQAAALADTVITGQRDEQQQGENA